MRRNHFLLGIIIVMLFGNCRAKKSLAKTNLLLKIEVSEMYCGGAAPPAEVIKELALMKPFANKEVEVYLSAEQGSIPKVFKTNSQGELLLSRQLGEQIFISVYPSAELYLPKNESEKPIYECYKGFILGNLIPVNMTIPEDKTGVAGMIQCNPCLPAAP